MDGLLRDFYGNKLIIFAGALMIGQNFFRKHLEKPVRPYTIPIR